MNLTRHTLAPPIEGGVQCQATAKRAYRHTRPRLMPYGARIARRHARTDLRTFLVR